MYLGPTLRMVAHRDRDKGLRALVVIAVGVLGTVGVVLVVGALCGWYPSSPFVAAIVAVIT
jgi:hypothetical protein